MLKIDPGLPYYPEFEEDEARLADFDAVNRRLYLDFQYLTLPTILRNFDRCSMAHGVEIRAPFMDWRVVCGAFAMGAENKIRDGYSKFIIREALADITPDQIRYRPTKLGFVSPRRRHEQSGMRRRPNPEPEPSTSYQNSPWKPAVNPADITRPMQTSWPP